MKFIKRICLALGLLSALLFLPSSGWCVDIDPYTYHTIIGTVFFEYEHETRTETDSSIADKTSNFRQNYGLTLQGFFMARTLAIYDGSFDFERESTTNNSSKHTRNNFSFDVKTTLLPLSQIPLTLFGSRSFGSSSSTGGSVPAATTTTVGLDWTGKFRVLPLLRFSLVRTAYSLEDDNSHDLRIGFSADKNYGPTTNRFNYGGTFSGGSSGSTGSTNTIGFTNTTLLSSHSTFNLGVTGNNNSTNDIDNDTVVGVTMGLNSYPSRFFSQSHNFSYFRNTSDNTTFTGTTYGGSLRYDLSRKISTNLSLGISKTFTETPTSSLDLTTTNASGSLAYKLTEHLYTTQVANFSLTESSSSEQSTINLSDRKLVRTTSNLVYNRSFSRFGLNAQYGLGYLWDTDINLDSPDNGGQAITHNGGLSLNRIDITRFFFFDTSVHFSGVLKTTAGTVNDQSRSFSAHFNNRFWQRYIGISGGFTKSNSKEAVQSLEDKSEVTEIHITSNPIKGSSIALSAQRTVFFNDLSGFSHTNSGNLSGSYGHGLLGGALTGHVTYSILDRTFSGGSDVTRNTHYTLDYQRSLLRRVMWKFKASRFERRTGDVFTNNTIFANTAFYRLRAWSLSLTHSYSITQESTRDERDNRIFFRIGRIFARFY